MPCRPVVVLTALFGLSGCAGAPDQNTGGEGWSMRRSASESLARRGCNHSVLDNPALAQRLVASGFAGGPSPPRGAPVLGCSLRMGM
ncbi:hypothetical protein GCM10011504_11290 [Siccirubricoccus deserti]|uniref:Lipoprotein n=1 Tax=Siccirubricoccus deserti TaxID=2013562 RepID=A0A9X0QVL0_9PROT|nr:hypothetical protein [Siccirubricoccus deserti]MBC4014744.1 hypothetical protein [Siccirubricoccus deserti]GGC34636.1 hypothetical protein GCM10011504_11290 [Siccirubricoccus deserti]